MCTSDRLLSKRRTTGVSPSRTGRHLVLVLSALASVLLLWQPDGAAARLATSKPVHDCNSHGLPRGCVPVPKGVRRPSKSINEQGGAALTPTEVADGGGLGGGAGEGQATAVAWARTQLGSAIWAWRCERFVEESFGTRYIYPSAAIAAQHLPLRTSSPDGAPVGALIFFGPDSSNDGYGHVGLSLGAGKMISALATVQITNITKSRYWSTLYRGWAYPPVSWPGRIPPPPAPTGPLISSAVQITAPAFNSTVSGKITLEAAAQNVSGVAFEAYYATEPTNAQTLGWHPVGNATLQSGSWALEWNTASVPDQGNAQWGTVNIAAIALNDRGELTGTRDYRRITINNNGGPGGVKVEKEAATPTFAETAGGVTHTWTDYTNAGGTQGPSVPANTTVQVTCALSGFRVADGNTWWYRIASSPWNNAYYASADAFYNNGETSGSLLGTPFVDPSVPGC